MKLLLTRPLKQSEGLNERLQKEGHEVFCLPLIEIVPPADGGVELKRALSRLAEYDWLVLTSQNAVAALQPHLRAWSPALKVAAAGPKTAAALRRLGCSPFYPNENFGAKGLIEFFAQQNITGKKFLYPRSSIGREELPAALREMKAHVDVVEAYRTRPSIATAHDIFCLLNKGIEAVLFFSPSQVAHFFELIRHTDERLQRISWIPFGPTTARALALSLRGSASGGDEAI